MKKKLLAGFLSLLMILTMASGVLGAVVTIDPSYGYGDLISTPSYTNRTMFDDCPNCEYDYAVYYIDKGNVKYACSACKATGYSYKTIDCLCGDSCICKVKCVCGKNVTCGKTCGNCNLYALCADNCKSCKAPEAVTTCPTCKTNICKCIVRCSTCNKTGECGDFCTKCGTALACSDKCLTCSKPVDHDCGVFCDCLVRCNRCQKTVVNCGDYCAKCGIRLECPNDCTTCDDYWDWDYKVSVIQGTGGEYRLSGGAYGRKGEVKVLTILTHDDFDIANVSINGVNYGSEYDRFALVMDRNYSIRITYREVCTKILYTVTAEAIGNGSITLQKNGSKVTGDSVQVNYNDVLIYRFVPAENYAVKDVKINGKSVGVKDHYTLRDLRAKATVSVEFVWESPYTDVADEHKDAVEYATTTGLMSSFYTYIHKDLFKGEQTVSLRYLAVTLAEMADVKDILSKDADRIQWMIDNGIVAKDADLKTTATVQTACEMIAKFLEVIEDKYDISFVGDKAENNAAKTCIKLKLTTQEAYKDNAKYTRYDLAELCYAIANLEYVD